MMSTPRSFTRGIFRANNQNPNTFRQSGTFERRQYPNNNNDRYNDYKARSQYQSDQGQSRDWGNNNKYSQSPSAPRQYSFFTDFADNPDQVHLTLQCLTGLETETRATIYPTTRNSQLPTTVTSQT